MKTKKSMNEYWDKQCKDKECDTGVNGLLDKRQEGNDCPVLCIVHALMFVSLYHFLDLFSCYSSIQFLDLVP